MSVDAYYQGGLENPKPVRLTTASATAIFTATDNNVTIGAFSLANETASATIVDIHFNDGSTDHLVFRRSVPADDTVIVDNLPLRLRSGNIFKATAATANRITVTPIITRSLENVAADGFSASTSHSS